MFASYKTLARFISVFLLTALASCGGGGGGGGGSSNGSSGTLSLSTSVLTFDASNTNTTPPAQVVTATVTGVSSGTLYIKIVSTGPAVASISGITITGPTTGQATVNPASATLLGPGTFTSTITVTACTTDPNCSSGPLIGSPQTINVTYTIANFGVSPDKLNFDYVTGGAIPGMQTVNVTAATGVSWTATANQSWITLANANGVGPSSLGIGINPAGLAAGTYTGEIAVALVGTGGTAKVGVTLRITTPVILANVSTLSFSGVNGVYIPPQSVNVTMSNGTSMGWTATPGASWLLLNKASGTTPDSLQLSINPYGLTAGTYNTSISISGLGSQVTINVTLSLSLPTLSLSPSNISLGGADGRRDFSAKTVQLILNTGSYAYNWSASSSIPELQFSPASGSVSAAASTLQVSVDRSRIAPGTYSGTITLSALVNGNTITAAIPVSVNIDAHKILVSDTGVAFASTPARSTLTRTLSVRDNFGEVVDWSARSDQSWLGVTGSGMTTGDLVLTANPAGLTINTVHYATVSITSSNATVKNIETVRVGLWVGSDTPNADRTIAGAFNKIITDPIRPYAYVHSGGSDITVYNIYTAAVVATIPSVAPLLDNLAIAIDGSRLFAVDKENFKIVPIDLPDFTVGTGWAIGTPVSAFLEYTRSNGVGLLISGSGRIFNAASGSTESTTFSSGASGNNIVAASLSGNRLCSLVTGVAPAILSCYSLDYSNLNGSKVLLGSMKRGLDGVFGEDVAINADGSRAFVAIHDPNSFSIYDLTTTAQPIPVVQTLPASSIIYYPGNAEIARNGFVSLASEDSIWFYDENAVSPLGASNTFSPGLLPRQLRVSGDGLHDVVLGNNEMLIFPAPAP